MFSQREYTKLRELNRFEHSENFGLGGLNILWLNPDFSELNRSNLNLKVHSHNFYEVHFILSGTVTYSDGFGEVYEAGENEYIFVPPCIRHKSEGRSESYKKLVLAFSYQPEGDDVYVFSDKIYKKSGGVWTQQLFSLLSEGIGQGNGKDGQIFQNIASLLVMFLAEKKIAVAPSNRSAIFDERFIRAKSFIEDNSMRDISVDEVAAYVFLSNKHLGRLFKQNCNMTVADVIAEARCDRAKKMLEDNKSPVSKIVDSLGFSNEQNFNRFFKRVTGYTPGAYRGLKGQMR